MKDKIQADGKMIDKVYEESKERWKRRKGSAYTVTVKVITNPVLNLLSKNDLDRVDTFFACCNPEYVRLLCS